LEADRIALNNMFRAIAEYGHKVRLRRQAEIRISETEGVCAEPHAKPRGTRRRRKRDAN